MIRHAERKALSKMRLFRLRKIEKGHYNSLQIHKRLLQKESSQFLVLTVDRRTTGLYCSTGLLVIRIARCTVHRLPEDVG